MTKEEYYRKLLEAQVRGMLTGTFDTHGRLSEEERTVFFDEVFKKGLFVKNSAGHEKYSSFDEMLDDFKKGKKILNLQTPMRKSGAFSLPKNHADHYAQFNRINGQSEDKSVLNLRTSFESPEGQIIRSEIASDPGPEPAVPGGFFSGLWNSVVKLFTGHSSEAWAEYDEYTEKKAIIDRTNAAAADYEKEHGCRPGTEEDDFSAKILDTDRKGRIERGEEIAQDIFINTKNAADRIKLSKEEKLKERIDAQSKQSQVDYNRKAEELKNLDIDAYNNFFRYDNRPRQFKSIDEALAAAQKTYEAAHKEELKAKAIKDIHDRQVAVIGNMGLEIWKRDTDTDKLINDNAYEIEKFLKINRNNPEFRKKVEAETESLKKRCEEIENPIFYTRNQKFNDIDIELKVAISELGIEGAEKYRLIADIDIEAKKAEMEKHHYEAPVISTEDAEKHLAEGTVTEEEIDILLEEEDRKRSDIIDEGPKYDVNLSVLMNSAEFDFDIDQSGIGSTTLENKILTLKMMRAQHEAVKAAAPIPFLFSDEEQKKQSVEQAFALGFITKEKADEGRKLLGVTEPEASPEDIETQRLMHEREEEEARVAEEHEKNLNAKAEFLSKSAAGELTGIAAVEYKRLSGIIEESNRNDDPLMNSLAKKADEALKHVIDAKFGLAQYDEEDAINDITYLAAIDECNRNPAFRLEFEKNEETGLNTIRSVVRHSGLYKSLLETPPQVDSIFFKDNRIEGTEENLSIAGVFMHAKKEDMALQEKNHQKSVEESLREYSDEQRKLLSDPVAMANIQTKLASQSMIDGNMTKEEEVLRLNANHGMAYIYSEVLIKPQSNELNLEEISEYLTDIAMYQSLKNPEYRKAYLKLTSNAKNPDASPELREHFSEKYREFIQNQINVSGIIPEIKADRTAVARYLFSDNSDFFGKMEKTNVQKKVTFGTVADIELQHIASVEKKFADTVKEYASSHSKAEANKKFEPEAKFLKLCGDVMKSVCADIKAGSRLSMSAQAEASKTKTSDKVLGK